MQRGIVTEGKAGNRARARRWLLVLDYEGKAGQHGLGGINYVGGLRQGGNEEEKETTTTRRNWTGPVAERRKQRCKVWVCGRVKSDNLLAYLYDLNHLPIMTSKYMCTPYSAPPNPMGMGEGMVKRRKTCEYHFTEHGWPPCPAARLPRNPGLWRSPSADVETSR
jgi:hypothetical protein